MITISIYIHILSYLINVTRICTLQGGCTLLHFSAQCGFVEITELLIEQYGMDPACEAEVRTYVCMCICMYACTMFVQKHFCT